MRKYLPHALALGLFLCVSVLVGVLVNLHQKLEVATSAIAAQQAQIIGQKDEIQKANEKLGLAESSLVSRDTIISQYKKDVESMGAELRDLRTKVKTKPVSRDSGVIVVDREVPGGTQTATTAGTTTEYDWVDPTGRFKLVDPDIHVSGNEKFTYKLKIRVTGYVLEDETGAIKARQVVAQELLEKKNPDGTVSVEVGERLEIENNIYQYSRPEKNSSILDIFNPRAFVLFDTSLNPGLGVELINLGNYLDYVNIGAGPFISIEVDDFPNKLPSSLLGLGFQYNFLRPFLSTNIGIGIGIATPADEFLGRFLVTGNLIFYLTN